MIRVKEKNNKRVSVYAGGDVTSRIGTLFQDYRVGRPLQKLLVSWLNYLKIWRPLAMDSLVSSFKSGVLLCKIIQFHQPTIKFLGLNEKAIARNACTANIEKGLAEMWKNKACKQVRVLLSYATI